MYPILHILNSCFVGRQAHSHRRGRPASVLILNPSLTTILNYDQTEMINPLLQQISACYLQRYKFVIHKIWITERPTTSPTAALPFGNPKIRNCSYINDEEERIKLHFYAATNTTTVVIGCVCRRRS